MIHIAPNVYSAMWKEQLDSLRYKRLAKYAVTRILYRRISSLVQAIILKFLGNISESMNILRKNFQVNWLM